VLQSKSATEQTVTTALNQNKSRTLQERVNSLKSEVMIQVLQSKSATEQTVTTALSQSKSRTLQERANSLKSEVKTCQSAMVKMVSQDLIVDQPASFKELTQESLFKSATDSTLETVSKQQTWKEKLRHSSNTTCQPALTDNKKTANQFALRVRPSDALKPELQTGHPETVSKESTPTNEIYK
jgi:hypothetical protein